MSRYYTPVVSILKIESCSLMAQSFVDVSHKRDFLHSLAFYL